MSPAELLRNIDASWRAASDLSVEQIYLKANPLREVPLEYQHIVPRLLGPRDDAGSQLHFRAPQPDHQRLHMLI